MSLPDPDMLEVGVSQMPARGGLEFLSPAETRSHFAAWCIVSSPLILSHDLTNDTTMNAVWAIISNREALAVNAAYVVSDSTHFIHPPTQ
jgi:hypothetical protein